MIFLKYFFIYEFKKEKRIKKLWNKKNLFFIKKLLNYFFCIGIFFIISGKFSIFNGKKKKIKIKIGKFNFSSKKYKLNYLFFSLLSKNGIFSIKIFLSFI